MLRPRRGGRRTRGPATFVRAMTDGEVVRGCRLVAPFADDAQLDRLAAATRQWRRLVGGHPRARLAQPSSAVGDVWRALGGPEADHDGGRAVEESYRLACADEDIEPPHLPLLFRVDWVLDRLDGRTYVPNCGETRYCAVADGTVCLQHAARPPRRRVTWRGPEAGGPMADAIGALRTRP